MLVTCEQCQSVYKVEERLLGLEGRTVRCMDCKHTWHQEPPPPPPEEVVDEPPAPEETPDWMKDEEPKDEELQLVSHEKGKYFHESEMDIPDAVKPKPPQPVEPLPQAFQIPAMTHRPLGMAAGQFGVCVFLALAFLTLSTVFIGKRQIVTAAPAMAYFYKSIGIDMKAPGEGLSLSQLTAEARVNGVKRMLSLEAKVSNITNAPIDSPALRVQLKSAYGAVLKKWEFSPESDKPIAAGETVPLELNFKDPPEDGKTVELKVIDR